MRYKKHFIPLESNPTLFTELIHNLGVSHKLSFHDVWSLDDDELLALIPRPVLAFVIVFPTPPDYETLRVDDDISSAQAGGERDGGGKAEEDASDRDILWFKQTINNACGLYGILHATMNGGARDYINPGSHLYRLLEKSTSSSLCASDRAELLENDDELEGTYKSVAVLGDTAAPENPEDKVDFHYVCFVKSRCNDNLYLLDGDRERPLKESILRSSDLLCEQGTEIIHRFIKKHDNGGNFSLLALAPVMT